jgi:hypothetical protein
MHFFGRSEKRVFRGRRHVTFHAREVHRLRPSF